VGSPSPTSVNEKGTPPLQDLLVLLVELLQVVTIAVGSVSMICLLPVFSESYSESGFGSLSLISTTNDYFEDIHRCCARGFCGNCTIFRCPYLSSCDPSFPMAWTGFWKTVC
jgi:hypothetical protein